MSIDLSGDGRVGGADPFDHRRRDRRMCDLRATVIASHGEWRARIINISAGGLGLIVDSMFGLKPGEQLSVQQQTLGKVRCTVRWSLHPRYGAEFEPPGRTPASARTLYDSLAPATPG